METSERAKSTYIDQDGCWNCKHAINENAGGMEAEYSCPLIKSDDAHGWVWPYGVCSEWEKRDEQS